MKKWGISKSVLAALLSMSMLLAACSSGSPGASSATPGSGGSTSSTPTSAPEEVVTLRLLVIETGTSWNTYPNHAVAQEIADKIGVKIEYVEADDSKFSVLLAGGDLPDIVRSEPAKYGRQLIEGELIIPMDELLEQYGQDILANVGAMVDFSRENWSEGRNEVYFLSPQIQSEPTTVYTPLTIGPTIRWDLYKDIGAPEFNTPDELLDVLAQIVEKYPETEEGRRMYGVSMFQDWGLWPYVVPFAWYTMQTTNNSDLMARKLGETQYRNILTDEDSTFWVAMDFYNKAYNRGLLDPDALTMKYNDYLAKATAGQIVLGPATWAMGDFNSKFANEGQGYVVLPAGNSAWSGGVNSLGWTGKSYSISKSSKHAEKAMQFLNYMYSYEGVRTLYSGVEGIHWDMVDGKPQLREATLALKTAGDTEWNQSGINLDPNLMGLGSFVIDPATDTPVDLFTTSVALATGITALEKDFSEYYGGLHPGDVLAKLIEDGTLVNNNLNIAGLTAEQIVLEGQVGLPAIPENLVRIEAQVKELASRYAARLILASNEAEFAAIKEEALEAFRDAGVDEFTEYYTTEYAQRRETVGALPAAYND